MIISLMLFAIIDALLLVAMYWFLRQQDFGYGSFVVASIMFVVASSAAGYIVLSEILDTQQDQEQRLMNISKEMLHEINIPISTIDANLSMLKRSTTDQKELQRLDRISAALLRLKRLYSELSYSIKKDIMPIQKEEFDLKETVKERVSSFKELAINEFELDLEPFTVFVDRIGLEQMLDNIIENAIKYSDKNSKITITLKNGILKIQDLGIGISPEQMVHIYDRYYQGDSSTKGEGIGLALAKQYCDREGIAIDISSSKGIGTTITLGFGNTEITQYSV